MEQAQIVILVTEIKGELATPPGLQDSVLENYIKEGIADIKASVADGIDFEKNLNARSLLKNYVRYAYYGIKDEFYARYHAEYFQLGVEHLHENSDT